MNYHIIIDGFIGQWGYSKQYVRYLLNSHKSQPVDIKISSLGGDLDHGLDIRQQLIDHGDVTVYLSGFVASAATVIAMGAKRVVMSKYAMFLVHKCSNFIDAWGAYNADQMQKLIEELEANKKENDKIDVVLANMYAAKCKKPVKDILNILKEGRWLTAQEAYDLGFVDELSEPGEKEAKLNLSPELNTKFNALGISTLGLAQVTGAENQNISDGLLTRIVTATARIFGLPESNGKDQSISQPAKNDEMDKRNFKTVESLLKIDSISADAEGYVSVTADQFCQINDKMAVLEKAVTDNAADISAKEAEINSLKTQVENLKKAPGDDTFDVKEDGAEHTVTASVLYNLVKSAI